MDFQKQNFIVVGAGNSDGICGSFVKELIAIGVENIAIFDLIRPSYVLDENPKVQFYSVDVTDKQSIQNAFDEVVKQFKRVDVMVNGAGIARESNVEATFNVNAIGLINCCEIAIKHMGLKNGGEGGTIVNIASILGLQPFFRVPVYTASKFAVVGYTRCLSEKFFEPKFGIKFITICPGFTDTPMIASLYDENLCEDVRRATDVYVNKYGRQTSMTCGALMVDVLTKSSNGSVWRLEYGKASPVEFHE